jgi:tRNA modification GTPase
LGKRAQPFDTIAAIATPVGEGGIGIVRISGAGALKIADKIFFSSLSAPPSQFKSFTTHYGLVKDRGRVVDEVILTVMRAPKSYTKEDIVEVNCHGGIIALRGVLDLVLEKGARLAEPGEFTKRAFLNGRIDLTQAEAVLDIIRAKTDSALKAGIEQLKGGLSGEFGIIRGKLLDALSQLEADIDFPSEELSLNSAAQIMLKLEGIEKKIAVVLENAARGRIMREGIHAVICGRPNTGKSSLLNALLRQERSIVTPVAGTTRDYIEEIIDIKGIPVRIVDTAGILEPRDLVEKAAVESTKSRIKEADLILAVFDGSVRISKDDLLIIKKTKGKPAIALLNKMELKQKFDRRPLLRNFKTVIEISAKKGKNIRLLEGAIADSVYKGGLSPVESAAIASRRHTVLLREAKNLVAKARDSLDNKLTIECVAEELKAAMACFDEILGLKFSEGVLDRIFSHFCIGK